MLSRHKQPPVVRIEVFDKCPDPENSLREQITQAGFTLLKGITTSRLYFLEGNLTDQQIQRLTSELITDPVTETYTAQKAANPQNRVETFKNIETTLRPGVTDNTANEFLEAAHRLGFNDLRSVATGKRYQFEDELDRDLARRIACRVLMNETIERYEFGDIMPEFIPAAVGTQEAEVILVRNLDTAELEALSKARRLALSLPEMQALQEYFRQIDREPTDAELETIAQTWSEHCVHKTFKAEITIADENKKIDSLIRTYLQAATKRINAPWVHSAFVDNAGVIAFNDQIDLSFKVETHNHPSAIEPFGGSNTGVGGVVRDILGVSHRPIANTNVLCFGPQNMPSDSLPKNVMHPRRIKQGVVHGIEDYGNKLGLPTVNGAILYHEGYTANPLVFCGSVGIGPRDSHPRSPQEGDRVVVLGGKTGRDGLRGATFSSQIMDTGTSEIAGASVQIGDPITEKGLLEVVERARDMGLYNAITDCGAGGLSSAVGEMGSVCGVRVQLENVPLKYAGLAPWEIWLSEAQERIVLAVPQEKLPDLQNLCDTYWVELSDIGEFTRDDHLRVFYSDNPIVDLDNEFLHHGNPRLDLVADLSQPLLEIDTAEVTGPQNEIMDESQMLLALLSHPNIASKADTIHRYDTEVRGGTVVKPLAGIHLDGPSDAAVMKPLGVDGWQGFSLANGINPFYGEIDAYGMAISVIDEAVRNAVAVGADPDRMAILDNFCWGNPNDPKILGSLVKAAQGCYDGAVMYQTPFISGKDSLYNEYLDEFGERRAIPGTLLVSSIAIVPDVRKAITMDLKESGNTLYLLGDWQACLGGSHAVMCSGGRQKTTDGWVNQYFGQQAALGKVPQISKSAPAVYRKLHDVIQQGLIRSAHDLSEGGLLVAAAEMSLAGRLGAMLDLTGLDDDFRLACFAETNGCVLVEVREEDQSQFETAYSELPILQIGTVTDEQVFKVQHASRHFALEVDALVKAFNGCEVKD